MTDAINDADVDAERRVRRHEQFVEAWRLSKRTPEKLYACDHCGDRFPSAGSRDHYVESDHSPRGFRQKLPALIAGR